MAIAVMGDDAESTSSLILRLSSLGFDAIHAKHGSRAFARVLEAADVILCTSLEQAAAGTVAVGRLPGAFVWLADRRPCAQAMLAAMRQGVIDVVKPSADDAQLGARLREAVDRVKPTDLRIAGQLDTLERDQRAGRYIQLRMLPASPTAIGNYRLAHRVQPSMILSGDFVDYFRMAEGHLVFYIADVSGHGASSAFVTVILKNFFRRLRREYRPRMLRNPGEILAELNRELLEHGFGKHVAMFIGVVDIDANRVAYTNAGHFPHAIHAAADGAEYLEMAGKPVGLFDSVAYEVETVDMASGDSLVMFSDGALETLSEDGLAAKEAHLVECAARQAPDIAAMWGDIGVVDGSPGPDDVTCLVVAREG